MAPTAGRVRTSFDPEHELPRLHQWFAENPHPSRLTLQVYVRELNSLPSRQARKLLEVHNLCYWFKNARAAYKRAEMRMKRESIEPNQAAANSLHPHHHFSCQPRAHLQQWQQQQQQQQQNYQDQQQVAKLYDQDRDRDQHQSHPHVSSHVGFVLRTQNNNININDSDKRNSSRNFSSSGSSSSSSPTRSNSPPGSRVHPINPLAGIDAELAALKLAATAAAAAVVVAPPAAAVANLAAAAGLKSLLAAATSNCLQASPAVAVQPPPPVPPLAPFSELDTDRSLYLLLFFMKFFELDKNSSPLTSWQTELMTQRQQQQQQQQQQTTNN